MLIPLTSPRLHLENHCIETIFQGIYFLHKFVLQEMSITLFYKNQSKSDTESLSYHTGKEYVFSVPKPRGV